VTAGRGRHVAAGIAALAALIALTAGLPVLLYRLGGSPLPGHLPGLSQVGHGLLHRETPEVFLAVVRDVSWLAWAAFTLAVLTEVQAVARRRTPPRLWLGGLQGAAGRLVALAALTFTSAPAATLLATPQPVSSVAMVPQAEVTGMPSAHSHGQGMSMDFFQLVTVRPGDCLWSIAQHYLGSGDRYHEIVQLNLGHDMGHGQQFSDPAVIQPGWVLHVPSGGDGGGSHPGSHGGAGTGSTGQHGTHTGHPTHDHHFRHRHHAAPPGGGGQAGGQPGSGGQGSSGAGQGGSARPVSATGSAVRGVQDNRMALFLAFGGGVLAGGAAIGLARLRHRQRQVRRRGRRIALPASAPVAEAEQRLNLAAAQEPLTGLRTVLRYLGAELLAEAQPIPDITALLVRPEFLDVLLAGPAAEPPPEPFTVPGGYQGMTWRLALSDELAEPFEEPGDLLPGLLAVGAADDGYLLVDLEQLQVTTVSGPASRTRALLRTAAAELATGQLAGWYELILVGFGELAVLGGRATCCDSLEDGLDLLAAKAVALRRRLGRDGDVRARRLAEPADEDWALTLLVSSIPPTAGQLALLADLATDPGGVAALVPGGAEPPAGHRQPASFELSATPDGSATIAQIWPLQAEARCEPLDDADYEALTDLFVTASEGADVGPADPPYDAWTWPPDVVDPGAGGVASGNDRAGPDTAGDEWADGSWAADRADGAADEAGMDDYESNDWAEAPVQVGQLHWAAPDWASPEWADSAQAGDGAKASWASPEWGTGPAPAPVADPGPGAVLVRDRLPAAGPGTPGSAHGGSVPGTGDRFESGAGTGTPTAVPSWPDRPAWSEDPEVTGLPGRPAAWLQDPPPAGQPEAGQPGTGPPATEASLRIGVLGSFTVNGQPGALLPAQSQLVLALALNSPAGLSNAQLCYLLGADPDRPKPSDSLRQLIVRTRRQLGRAADDREWIVHLGGGQYALHPDARFDWSEFSALAEDGLRNRDAQLLGQALRLVRGQPFAGCYYWWLDLAVTETVRAQIVDAADVLAGLETAAGDPAAAARAARTGLIGDATAEQLWRALMRAEHAAGNLSGVREAWKRCLDAIAEIAPDGEPHPGTAALYQELIGGPRGGRRRAAG
jgi:DNA-binding SARP family transcriptional activator